MPIWGTCFHYHNRHAKDFLSYNWWLSFVFTFVKPITFNKVNKKLQFFIARTEELFIINRRCDWIFFANIFLLNISFFFTHTSHASIINNNCEIVIIVKWFMVKNQNDEQEKRQRDECKMFKEKTLLFWCWVKRLLT